MNVLYLYNSTQTFTNTVFEHIASFKKYSRHNYFFCHQDQCKFFNVDLSLFEVVIVHFTIRLPFDQLSDSAAQSLSEFPGLKVLFIQDEYDHTHHTWYWIKRLGFNLVFTVVPAKNIDRVYPAEEFPGVRFINNLTGYVPENLSNFIKTVPPSDRELIVGYRGRPLPIRYGQLGFEKVEVGRVVKNYCEFHRISHSIAWEEEARIYGSKWYEFMASCRSMLGSESGSNVFDWDATLESEIQAKREENPELSDEAIYRSLILKYEMPSVMNQVSPRIFEAIAARTALVLYEGDYSGVVEAGKHFIPLQKDGSNLEEVFSLLRNGEYVNSLTDRAYQDVIASGEYSYRTFVAMVDDHIQQELSLVSKPVIDTQSECLFGGDTISPSPITSHPIRAVPRQHIRMPFWKKYALLVWSAIPECMQIILYPPLKKIFGKG